ncbi:molybdenum cofactor biosynthesis protein B [Alkalihalobacillus sp. AL-G]|uniref:MogA/MoaB family molybdenum cofactor biosynthesis protein n=1 Tax=Alkalihalobacillus sp. AL-G TaxID=2926399 RepID=UPI002729D0A9|nr:MogA/MoaB family molybdenum cofactor biosynthesis protein [Alkalihalobacillus sp. AL-G]WLD92369.1 MogA/MoaB family molybdenum cofactor biosynthesis protein [Alkalihalobacillus sp. AL-G]
MSVEEHKRQAPDHVSAMVITVSDTRTEQTDKSGGWIIEKLQSAGHFTVDYEIVQDEAMLISETIRKGAADRRVDVILVNGGTGISRRDVTVEVVTELLDKEIPGFGELFRMLSYTEDIGSAAILSRAIAGVYDNTAVFAMPGSTGAVKLAMNKLILPEIGHVVREIRKDL